MNTSLTFAALLFSVPATCNLPGGDLEAVDTNEGDITTLRMQCYYANPVTDRAVILSGMAKTAAARQHWIRTNCPSITEVLEQYPRFEDVPLDLVCSLDSAFYLSWDGKMSISLRAE